MLEVGAASDVSQVQESQRKKISKVALVAVREGLFFVGEEVPQQTMRQGVRVVGRAKVKVPRELPQYPW